MADRRTIYQGRRISLAIDRVELPDGGTVEREVVVHPGAVAIVPLVDRSHVCMVRNRRHAVGQTLLELPAGTLEPGEDPERTAVRELAEETGYSCGRIQKLFEFFVSPGVMTERMFLYLAEDLTPGSTKLDAGEVIEPEIVPWSRALELVRTGVIQDAKSIAGILFCEQFRPWERGERA